MDLWHCPKGYLTPILSEGGFGWVSIGRTLASDIHSVLLVARLQHDRAMAVRRAPVLPEVLVAFSVSCAGGIEFVTCPLLGGFLEVDRRQHGRELFRFRIELLFYLFFCPPEGGLGF